MRRLFYVPIVHAKADMGSAGSALARESQAIMGERRWRLHLETAARFWDVIGDCLRSLNVVGLKVYQDGLPVNGMAGRRIVEEAVRRGSRNYQLVMDMLERGALLCKTEDPQLLWRERQELVARLKQEHTGLRDAVDYQQRRDQLMESRDKYIAETIDTTLRTGEAGVLFIGAAHNVLPHLAADIEIKRLKEPGLVIAYFEELFGGNDDRKLETMAQAITSPVAA